MGVDIVSPRNPQAARLLSISNYRLATKVYKTTRKLIQDDDRCLICIPPNDFGFRKSVSPEEGFRNFKWGKSNPKGVPTILKMNGLFCPFTRHR